ncbi:MAG: sugar transferase [Planctomycetota bacterium]
MPNDRLMFFLERARFLASRSDSTFCLVAFEIDYPSPNGPGVQELAEILEERLRITDDKGYLADGRIGVVLPETPAEGAHVVARQVRSRFAEAGGRLAYQVFVYPSDFDLDGMPQDDASADQETATHDEAAAHDGSAVHPMEPLLAAAHPRWKRAVDIAGSAGLIVLSAPLLAAVAVLVKAESPGPVFFVQPRTGHRGRTFRMFKFRSMRQGADAEKAALRSLSEQDGPAFKLTDDPRVTRVGRVLRSTSIDELPQLWNVLRGEMSLVGPRPLPVDEAEGCNTWQRRRLDVVPGLTCIWQVRGRSSVTFAQWVRMDLEYVRSMSLWNDVKILLQTVPSVISRKGAR